MYWLSRQQHEYKDHPLNDRQHLVDFLARVFVILVLCSSSLAFAETVDMVAVPDEFNCLDDGGAVLDDDTLLAIHGKGAEAIALESDSKLAIILWDEGRQGNKGGTNHEVNSRPVITLTVIQK